MENSVNKNEVGKRIKAIRLSLGLTLEQFGFKIDNASKSNVLKWEKGSNLPNKKRLKSIAELGNVSVDYLLNGINHDKLVNELAEGESLPEGTREKHFLSSMPEMLNFQKSGEIEFNEKLQEMINILLSRENIEKLNSQQSDLIFSFMNLLKTLFMANNLNDPLLNNDLYGVYFHVSNLIREINEVLSNKLKKGYQLNEQRKESLKTTLLDIEKDINNLGNDL